MVPIYFLKILVFPILRSKVHILHRFLTILGRRASARLQLLEALELGRRNFEKRFTSSHLSPVMCHVSFVTCHSIYIYIYIYIYIFFFRDKVVMLVEGGSVINEVSPV